MKDLNLLDDMDRTDIRVAISGSVAGLMNDMVEISSYRSPDFTNRSYLSLEDAARIHFWLGALLQREVSG
jgi:hypothetical protein